METDPAAKVLEKLDKTNLGVVANFLGLNSQMKPNAPKVDARRSNKKGSVRKERSPQIL